MGALEDRWCFGLGLRPLYGSPAPAYAGSHLPECVARIRSKRLRSLPVRRRRLRAFSLLGIRSKRLPRPPVRWRGLRWGFRPPELLLLLVFGLLLLFFFLLKLFALHLLLRGLHRRLDSASRLRRL